MNRLLLVFGLLFTSIYFNTNASCDGDHNHRFLKSLKHDGYHFLKSYLPHANYKKKTIEYTAVLHQGKSYRWMFHIEHYPNRNSTIQLTLKAAKKRRIIALSNIDLSSTTWYNHLDFECYATGIYYVSVELELGACVPIIMAEKSIEVKLPNRWQIDITSSIPHSKTTNKPQRWIFNLQENKNGFIQIKLVFREEEWEYTRWVHKLDATTLRELLKQRLMAKYGIEFEVSVVKNPK